MSNLFLTGKPWGTANALTAKWSRNPAICGHFFEKIALETGRAYYKIHPQGERT